MPFLVSFLIQILIGVAVAAVGYLLVGGTKTSQPEEFQDLENPTASAGREVPVLFGEWEITGVNIVWYGEKRTVTKEVSV